MRDAGPQNAYRYTRSARRRCGAITSVTEKCQDISDTQRPRRPGVGQDAVAMARGVTDEAERRVRAAGSGAGSMHGEAVPTARNKPAERIQMGQALPRGGHRRTGRSDTPATRLATAGERRGRAAGSGAAPEARVGSQEAAGIAQTEAGARKRGRAQRPDDCANHRAGRLRQEEEAPDGADRTSDGGPHPQGGSTERSVDGGLQGVVASARRRAVRAAHGAGRPQPLRTAGGAPGRHRDEGGPPGVPAIVRAATTAHPSGARAPHGD